MQAVSSESKPSKYPHEYSLEKLESEFQGTDVINQYATCRDIHASNFEGPSEPYRVTIGNFSGHVYEDFYRCLVEARISTENLSKILTIQSESELNYFYKLQERMDEAIYIDIAEGLRMKDCNSEVAKKFPKYYFYTLKDFVEKELIGAICSKYKQIIEDIDSGTRSIYVNPDYKTGNKKTRD